MLKRFFRRPPPPNDRPDAASRAAELFDQGHNCAQAVLQATTGRDEPDLLAMAAGFDGGLGNQGCLCGAVAGGVMALGLTGHSDRVGQLVKEFQAIHRTTCCRGLSKEHPWLSREHLKNCRRLTARAADLVENLLRA